MSDQHTSDRRGESPTVAVTGAAGYLGSRVVAELQSHHPEWDLIGCDNFYAGSLREIGDVTVDYLDVRNQDRLWAALEGADVVIHLAAVSGVDDCADEPEVAYSVNVVGTSHVARFCHQRSVPMVFPASMAVIGDPDPETFPITADQKRSAVNWYGRTKLIGERLLETFAEGTFSAHVFLKSNLYGTHQTGGQYVSKSSVLDFFVDRALSGEPLTVYEPGTQARNYVHVTDTARAYVHSAERLLEGRDDPGVETYTIASDEDPSVKELARWVTETVAENTRFDPNAELVENPRTAETLVDEFPVDTTRTRSALGWEPTRTIEDSIHRLVRARTAETAEPGVHSTELKP